MKLRTTRAKFIVLLVTVVVAGAVQVSGAASPTGHFAALDKLPDWKGVWTLKFGPPAPGATREQPALKGRYLLGYQQWQRLMKETNGNVPRDGSNCLPPGMPGMMSIPQYPIEFLFTPGRVTVLHEAWMQWRNIYTDGRGHPADADPSFSGHSVGRWEGDTLVVDTVGIKQTADLGPGMKHGGRLRISERIHLAKSDPDTLVDEMTVEDPEALEKPWHNTVNYQRVRDGELLEFVCAENDRNVVDESGATRTGVDR